MVNMMVDIETLSTRSDAAVLSIGVAVFDDKEIILTDGWAIAPEFIDGHIKPETVAWWMTEGSEDAVAFSFAGKNSPSTVAFNFKSTLARYDIQEVWANDPDFDLVILQHWWDRVNKAVATDERLFPVGKWPVHYRWPRSYRTIVAECARLGYPELKENFKGSYTAHNPIEDAASQARVVIEARKFLGGVNANALNNLR